MWAAADGSREIPQLHVDGKVRKKEKKLFFLIRVFFSLSSDDDDLFFLPFAHFSSFFQNNSVQFIGTFSTIQEMEDFGELDAALGRPKK